MGSADRFWNPEGGEGERLRLVELVEPGPPFVVGRNGALKALVAKEARERLAGLTSDELGRSFDEFSAYYPP